MMKPPLIHQLTTLQIIISSVVFWSTKMYNDSID